MKDQQSTTGGLVTGTIKRFGLDKVMYNAMNKTLKTFVSKGGDIVNYLTSTSRADLPPITDELIVMPTHEIAALIRRRQVSSEQVVRAFVDRATLVNVYLNAVIDERYSDAIRDAQAIDMFLKTCELTEEELAQQKPLLGVPFTTKDSIQVANMRWSSGCLRRKDVISHEDAPVVKNLRKAGAIPIALTNVPELLLWVASSNKLYGTTNNPFDFSRTPGGSSGGEAALMAAGGTPLSLCSDIGGSIRMPAFHCGLFGHKPSHPGVIDFRGTFPAVNDDKLEKLFTFGPITRYADDLLPALRVMAGEGIHMLRDIDKPVDLCKVCVYYIDDTGNPISTHAEPYISDAIRTAAAHLKKKYGCQVEKAQFKYFKYASLWYTLLFSNNQEVSKLITENTYKINPFIELLKSAVGQSDYSPSALTVAAAQMTTQAACSPESNPKLYGLAHKTLRLAQEEYSSLLGDNGVLIYITLPRTAPTHYGALFEFTNVCCPLVFNYLGAPSTQVPTGVHNGLPYGIQIVAAPYNDRLTLAVAKELESYFGGWIRPCGSHVRQC